MTASTIPFSLADNPSRLLQLAVEIYCVRAVEGTGEYRFVEYVTVAACGVNKGYVLDRDDFKSPTENELYVLGRQYAMEAGDIRDDDNFFGNPPEGLHGKSRHHCHRRHRHNAWNGSGPSENLSPRPPPRLTRYTCFFSFSSLSELSFGSRLPRMHVSVCRHFNSCWASCWCA
jgi:hypothetical protein